MDSNKECINCHENNELVCCKKCMNELIVDRIRESIQGDIANRVSFIIDEKVRELREEMQLMLKDKYIISIKRGKRITIV